MKKASRFMPKVAGRPISVVGWGLLAAFVAWALYMVWMYPLPSIGFVGLVTGWSLVSDRNNRAHLRTLAAARTGESICSFARDVDCRNVDTWIVRAVYDEIQEYLALTLPQFPVRCSDRLTEDLRIDPDELDELLVIDIAERTRRDTLNTEKNPYFGKVRTVRDLVLFFHAQPKLPGEPNRLPQPTCEDARA